MICPPGKSNFLEKGSRKKLSQWPGLVLKENYQDIFFFHPEFNTDVDTFRKFVKEQKAVSTDMSHLSLPKLHQKIKSDVEGLNAVVQQLGSGNLMQVTIQDKTIQNFNSPS